MAGDPANANGGNELVVGLLGRTGSSATLRAMIAIQLV
jgi:hypothetical protein